MLTWRRKNEILTKAAVELTAARAMLEASEDLYDEIRHELGPVLCERFAMGPWPCDLGLDVQVSSVKGLNEAVQRAARVNS